jgi:hypothetical protein
MGKALMANYKTDVVMYPSLLKKYICYLMDMHGPEYFAEDLSLCDAFPGNISTEEYIAFADLVTEVVKERGLRSGAVREGLC